jgi:hypothetical protein
MDAAAECSPVRRVGVVQTDAILMIIADRAQPKDKAAARQGAGLETRPTAMVWSVAASRNWQHQPFPSFAVQP